MRNSPEILTLENIDKILMILYDSDVEKVLTINRAEFKKHLMENISEWEREKEDEKPLKMEVLMDSYAEKIAEAREERHESEKVNVYVSTVVMAYDKALERLLKELKELFTRVDKASMDAIRIQSDYSAIFHTTDDYQNDLLDNAICGLNQAAENLEQLIGWRENGG